MTEILLENVNIVTIDPGLPRASALLIRDGVIQAVGELDAVQAQATRSASRIDGQGRTVLPGFVDAHAHLELLAYAREIAVDCRHPRVGSIEDIVRVLRERADSTPGGTWILGHGSHYQDSKLAERRYPDRYDLDRVSDQHPVIFRSSYHSNVFNSYALRALGVDRDTPAVPGGRIEHDENGEPTGRTFDMFGALGVPEEPVESLAAAMTLAQDAYLSYGVTSLGDFPLHPNGVSAVLHMAAKGDLRLRMAMYPKYPSVVRDADLASTDDRFGFEGLATDRVRHVGVKIFLDGGLTSSAAALYDPYPGTDDYRGELAYNENELAELVRTVAGRGLQCTIHAIGDRALDIAIAALEKLPAGGHRIEHAGNLFVTEERIRRMLDAGIVAVPQPGFLLTTASGYRAHLGEARTGEIMPFRRLLDAGMRLPGNSDAIGITLRQEDPLLGIKAAVTRVTADGEAIEPGQAITIDEALAMYTINAAAAIGFDDQIGSITVGKRADFAVFDRDPTTVDPLEITDLRVVETWSNGEVVYQSTAAVTK